MRIESYKGIEFVRISALPKEQQRLIHTTLDKTRIIKILRDHELLNDCVQVAHYEECIGAMKKVAAESTASKAAVSELKLAFK